MVAVDVPEISSVFQIGRLKEGFSLNKRGERIRRLDVGAVHLLRRGHPAARRRHQVDGLSAGEESALEPRRVHQLAVGGRVVLVLRSIRSWAGSPICGWSRTPPGRSGTPGRECTSASRSTTRSSSSRSRKCSTSPNFIDTGKFPASLGTIAGLEVYYRDGPWLYGTEYYVEKAKSTEANNPLFHGGDAFVSWIITGETRPYTRAVRHLRGHLAQHDRCWKGGPGALEAVLRVSYMRSGLGQPERRKVLARHADGELVPQRQGPPRGQLRRRRPPAVRRALQDGVLPGARSSSSSRSSASPPIERSRSSGSRQRS